jgi:two-component system NtrC family response regulator
MKPGETMDAERPRYFHLLSDGDVRALRPMLEILADRREEVLARWHALYLEHFRDAVTLSAPSFQDLCGRDLDALVRNLMAGDMDGFETDLRAHGRDLVERGVPFAEIVASLHLFEESAAEAMRGRLALDPNGPPLYQIFDKLSHCRIIVLSASYLDGQRSEISARLIELETEATLLAGGPSGRTHFHGLIGGSESMRRIYDQIDAVAGGPGAVLIAGESGTGKELVARAIHERSGGAEIDPSPTAHRYRGPPMGERPFIAINCAALPRELIESELFGHRKGAYTGAAGDYVGLIRSASGGTLFLDELTETAPETQAKLLRVLEERAVRPVGGTEEIPVEVRFIASTNRDPDLAVEGGLLRSDLFYRLAVHRILLPPLRARLEDVEPLAAHFAAVLAGLGLRRVQGLEPAALAVLRSYPWPGNVRELRNAIEHALTIGAGDRITRSDLPAHVIAGARPAAGRITQPLLPIPSLEEAERDLIVRALDATGGNKLQAARLLRISRHRLYDRLRKFGLMS